MTIMKTRFTPALASLPLALTMACSGPTGPTPRTELGTIAFHDTEAVTQVPDSVRVGVPFEISVRTYGDGCVTGNGTEVQRHGRSVDVRPYDVHSGAQVCTDVLRMFDHRATVMLETPGQADIRFHGMERPTDSVITVTRSVVVW